MAKDLNMIQSEIDCNRNSPKQLNDIENIAWNNLILRLELEDIWICIDFELDGYLKIVQSNKYNKRLLAQLNRFYIKK